jgi:dihydrofolate reductase
LKNIDSEEIKKLKQEPGKDMVIFGSGTIVQAMTNLNLIDEFRLMINPVILGQGKPMFKDMKNKVNLKLLNTKTFKNGNVLLCYQVK